MALTIDEADPCAAAAALRQVHYRMVAGQAAQSVTFRGGPNGTERQVVYHKADVAGLLRLIRDFEDKCAAASGGKPRRFALRAGGMIR